MQNAFSCKRNGTENGSIQWGGLIEPVAAPPGRLGLTLGTFLMETNRGGTLVIAGQSQTFMSWLGMSFHGFYLFSRFTVNMFYEKLKI